MKDVENERFERARTLPAKGVVDRARKRTRAEEPLEQALAIFKQVGRGCGPSEPARNLIASALRRAAGAT